MEAEEQANGSSDVTSSTQEATTNQAHAAEHASLDDHRPPLVQDQAKAWIRENRTLAVLGAFAVGVFVGVLMRR